MKKWLLAACGFLGGCAPADYRQYTKTVNNYHPPLVHKMEQLLAWQATDTVAEHVQWAQDFWAVFENNFKSYKPNKQYCIRIFEQMKSMPLSVVILGGNWCDDTKKQVPKLLKALHVAGLSADAVEYYQVNRDKEYIYIEDKGAWIQKPVRVPTVYVYLNKKLWGTIVETPFQSWEKHLLSYMLGAKQNK